MSLSRPAGSQPHYGEHLGDVEYWSPHVHEVLERHGLPVRTVERPFVGSFPTFLCGEVVVKFFGAGFDGARSYTTEVAMCELLATDPVLPAPALVASGQLFDSDWTWPYLVTERVAGTAVRTWPDISALPGAELGAVVAHLHTLPPPVPVTERDLLPRLRADAARRLRTFGLPEHLVAQVPEFLSDASSDRVLVHADITADHLFLDRSGITAIIDWGDAIVADPWYELVAVYFDCLRGDRRLFAAFLDGYGRGDAAGFSRRALQGVLEFQFNAITGISEIVDLSRTPTLTDLARRLFDL